MPFYNLFVTVHSVFQRRAQPFAKTWNHCIFQKIWSTLQISWCHLAFYSIKKSRNNCSYWGCVHQHEQNTPAPVCVCVCVCVFAVSCYATSIILNVKINHILVGVGRDLTADSNTTKEEELFVVPSFISLFGLRHFWWHSWHDSQEFCC